MKTLILVLSIIVLSSCASIQPDPNRAGCYSLDGKARYGSFTQNVKGEAKGVHVYIGDNLKGKVNVTCNKIKQEILYLTPVIPELPEWIEEDEI